MSAFLGPIHYWLYNKITVQNSLVEEIIKFADKEYTKLNLGQKADNQFGNIDTTKPLEEMIDTSNIHGWLQECVSIVEYRLAFAVTALLKENPDVLESLKELFKEAGKKLSNINQGANAEEIFKNFNDTLLDGMPCDHANLLVSGNEQEVIYKRNVCVHENYWNSVGGDIKNYYLLREEFIKGLISNTNASFEKVDEITNKITV
jgi:hypothetical protein